MVKGLEIFRDFFRNHADQYMLIGGTACDIALQAVGYSFRATKDLDIVLCIEVLNKEFVKVFWDFIKLEPQPKQRNCRCHDQNWPKFLVLAPDQ